jgi:DNA-binding GntR family transcriptional regulator
MQERYISAALRSFPDIANHVAPLIGTEADMYDRLWQSIISGQLKPGTKLREEVIGGVFGVSRTLVRKVLFIMEQEGIVELPPNRGAYVATPTPVDARHVCEAVRMIAVYAATSLASADTAISAADKQRLRQHIAQQKAAETEENFLQARMLSGEFQILLVQIHRNRILSSQFVVLITRLVMVMQMYQRNRYQPPRSEFQTNLVDAIERGDHQFTETAMIDFYQSIESTLSFFNVGGDVDLRAILTEVSPPSDVKTPRHGRRRKLATE